MDNTFKIKRLWRGKVLGVLVLALAVGLMAAPSIQAASIDLGTAANFAVLGLNGPVTINGASTEVTGDVGINDTVIGPPPPTPVVIGWTLTNQGTINGTAFLDTKSTLANTGTITGGSQVDHAKVLQAKVDALAAAALYGAMTTSNNAIVFDVAGNGTVTGNGGLNIINLGAFSVSGGKTLTLNGTAADAFLFNINGLFEVDGTIALGSNVLARNVLFNVKVTGSEALISDPGVMSGIILDANVGSLVDVHGKLTGLAIGTMVTVQSGGFVHEPAPIPVPPSAILFGSGLLGFGLMGWRKWSKS
jgi:hypothetical protein